MLALHAADRVISALLYGPQVLPGEIPECRIRATPEHLLVWSKQVRNKQTNNKNLGAINCLIDIMRRKDSASWKQNQEQILNTARGDPNPNKPKKHRLLQRGNIRKDTTQIAMQVNPPLPRWVYTQIASATDPACLELSVDKSLCLESIVKGRAWNFGATPACSCN